MLEEPWEDLLFKQLFKLFSMSALWVVLGFWCPGWVLVCYMAKAEMPEMERACPYLGFWGGWNATGATGTGMLSQEPQLRQNQVQ